MHNKFTQQTDHHEVTAAVQDMYESFPYPAAPIAVNPAGFSPLYSFVLAQYARSHQFIDPQGKRFLCAGCGTGLELQFLVEMNPYVQEIIGIDISQASLAIAEQRIKLHQLHNCKVAFGNLMQPETLPAGEFDFIVCYGVLHHTADITQAMQNLVQKLAPKGVIAMMLYNRSGRNMLYRYRSAFDILGVNELPRKEGIQFARNFYKYSVPGSYLYNDACMNNDYYIHDQNVVDNYFHPKDISFEIAEIPPLLSQANLRLLDVVPISGYWFAELSVSPEFQEFYERFQQLSLIDRLRVVELIAPERQTQNVFWCCQETAIEELPSFDYQYFVNNTWRLNPLFQRYAQVHFPASNVDNSFQLLSNPFELNESLLLEIKWLLVPNVSRSIKILAIDLQELLLPLSQTSALGSEILEAFATDRHETIVAQFKQWEEIRIVLRVSDS